MKSYFIFLVIFTSGYLKNCCDCQQNFLSDHAEETIIQMLEFPECQDEKDAIKKLENAVMNEKENLRIQSLEHFKDIAVTCFKRETIHDIGLRYAQHVHNCFDIIHKPVLANKVIVEICEDMDRQINNIGKED